VALPPNVQRIAVPDLAQSRATSAVSDAVDAVLTLLNAVFSGSPTSPVARLSGLTVTGTISAASAAIVGAITGQTLTLTGTPPNHSPRKHDRRHGKHLDVLQRQRRQS
jgi:hypothetical protein